MSDLKYEELKFPFYVNSSNAVKLTGRVNGKNKTLNLTFCDVMYAIELAGLNSMIISDTGRGKTQLMTDIAWYHFGGDHEGGNCNWADGRPNFEIEDLFVRQKVDLSNGQYDSDEARQLKEDRVRRLFFAVDEINRAPKPRQNDFFDLADGKYTFNGRRLPLGHAGYAAFMATANLNKLNGDFSGTFEMDRALLNRAHLTIDLDHKDFRPTPEDKIRIEERKANPKVDVPEIRDISDKILAVNVKIMEQARRLNPHLLAFRFLIDEGLDFCEKDKYKTKEAFPMLCSDCDKNDRICSLVKSSTERTIPAIKSLAYAFSYIAEMKFGQKGKPVEVDILDAALQAFRFTTYHGNLNHIVAQEEYAGRKQVMMEETAQKLSKCVGMLGTYIPLIEQGLPPIILVYRHNGKKRAPKTQKLVDTFKSKNISYKEISLPDELKKEGIGTDWVDSYTRYMNTKAKK